MKLASWKAIVRAFSVGIVVTGAIAVTATTAWASAPSAPQSFSVKAGPSAGNMTLRWNAPAADGGTPIVGYDYEYQIDGAGAWSAPAAIPGGASARKAVVACPAPQAAGHGCAYQIAANNGVDGTFVMSTLALWAAPTPPLIRFPVAGPTSADATISWLAPVNGGGLPVSYQYQMYDGVAYASPVSINLAATTQTNTSLGIIYSLQVPCTVAAGNTSGCSYRMYAVNAVGTGGPTATRLAPWAAPRRVASMSVVTTAISLGTGEVSQTISWAPPRQTAGVLVDQYLVWVCTTAIGSSCNDSSVGWTGPIANYTTPPLGTSTTNACPDNGRCSYEVWTKNAAKPNGHAFELRRAHPAGPIVLSASGDTSAQGELHLQWLPTPDIGVSFGHYVLFECDATANCANGTWANPAPWTRTDLVGTTTSTTYHCAVFPIACNFRVVYVDSAGTLGGVTNKAIASGLDAPTSLTATPGPVPGEIDLNWAPPPITGAGTSYQIYHDTGSGYSLLTSVPGNQTSYADVTCALGSSCSYKVRAIYGASQSADSAPATAISPIDTATTISTPTNGSVTKDSTPTLSGSAGSASGDAPTLTVTIHNGATTGGTIAQTLTPTRSGSAWTIDASTLADGTYTVQASQLNFQSQLVTSGAVTFTVDATAPAVATTSVNGSVRTFPYTTSADVTSVGGTCGTAPGDATTVGITIGGAGTETGNATCTAGTWTYTLTTPFSADGSYTVGAQQADNAGNTGTATTRTIVVDKTAPVVVTTSVNGSVRTFPYTTNTTVTSVGGSCGTAPGDATTVGITIGGGAGETGNASCSAGAWTYVITTPFSTDGSYSVAVQQADSIGNTGTAATRTITVDKTAPVVATTSVNGSVRTFPYTTNANVSSVGGTCGTAPGDAATVAITIGGAGTETGNANCTAGAWTYTLTATLSADGSYTVAAQQSDSTGNTGTGTTRTIVVDKTGPTVVTTSVNGSVRTFPYTTNATVTSVGGTCGTAPGDAATVAITIGGAGAETGNANCTAGAWTYALTTPFGADGSYTVAAQQSDSTGNTGTATTRTIVVDKTAPVVVTTSVNGTVRTFPYTTNTNVTSVGGTCGTATGDATTVAITIGGAGTETGTANCTAGNWTYTLTTAFSADGSYTIAAQQSDSTGNTGTATTRTITVDKTAPAVVTTSVNGTVRTFPYTTNTTVTNVGGTCGTAPGDAATVAITIGGAGTETGNANCTAGNWAYTLTTAFSADGSYTIAAQQSDSTGNTGTATTQTITVDKTAPAVATTSVNGSVRTFPYTTNTTITNVGGTCGTAPGDATTVAITIGGAGTETGNANCTAGNWTYTLTTAFSTDGSYTVAAQQADGAGNTGTAITRTIVVDASGPVVVITSVNGSVRTFPYTTNTTVTNVGGTCGTAPGDAATVAVTIGGAGTETGTANCTAGAWAYTLTTPFSADGSYTVAAQQSDSTGNTGTATTRTIVVDATAPVVVITSVNGSVRTFPYTTNTTVTNVGGTCGTAPGDAATVAITIGGAGAETGNANCTAGNWTYTLTTAFATDGSYTVAAQQTDSAGNTGTATTRTITVDKTAPAVVTTSVNGSPRTFPYTTNTTVTNIGGTCGTATGDATTVAITIGGAGSETGNANCTAGTWAYTLSTPFGTDGSYTVAAQQTDSAGNTGTAATRTITVDASGPVVVTTSVNGSPRTFPYTTNTNVTSVGGSCGTAPGDAATVAVTIGGAGSETGNANCTAGNWTYTLTTAFSTDGSYTVAAQQSDSTGNTGTATTRTITVDKTAPAVATTTVNGTVRTFPYTTNTNVTNVGGTCGTTPGDAATVAITIGGAGSETGNANCTAGAWTYTLTTPFSTDGSYTVAAQQADSAGNTGTATTRTITVDKTAPVVATTSVNGSVRTFPYTTNTNVTNVGGTCGTAPGDAATVAVTIGGAGSETGNASCTAGAWTYTLTTPLSTGGSYTVGAQQSDNTGNTGTATTQTITVDTSAPVVVITSVNGSVRTFPYTTNTTITNVGGTCGTAPGDAATVGITIGGAGTETGNANCTAGNWTYTLTTAFSADGSYTVAAQQSDNTGNTGTATTRTITVDKTAPAVVTTSVNGTARTFPYTTNTTVTNVGGTCGTTPGDAATVAITIGGAGSETGNANCTAGNWIYTLTAAFSTDGSYTVAAQQADSAGNTGTATTRTITVDASGPAVVTTSVNGTARTFPYTTNTTITNVGGTCGTALGDAATVAITIGGAGTETGNANCTAGAWTYTLTTPFSTDGSYTVAAQQSDNTGNTGTATTRTITVDKTAPAVATTSVNGTARTFPYTTNTTVTNVSGTCGTTPGDAATVAITIGGAGAETGTANCTAGNWTYTLTTPFSTDGSYTVAAQQTDNAGNTGTATTRTITVDKTAPAVVTTSVNGSPRTFPYTTNTTVTNLGGTCGTATGDATTVAITIGGAGAETGNANCTAGNWAYTLTTAFSADGSYTVAAQQSDSTGNTGTATTRTIVVDASGPAVVITSVNGTARTFPYTTNTTVTNVSGTCGTAPGDAATVAITVGGAGSETGNANCTAGNWTYTLTTAFSTDGSYTVAAQQSDNTGNTGTATTRTITVDKTAPAVATTSVNGTVRTFPYTTNTNVTNVGGTCGTTPGDAATVAITIGGAGSETGNANCTAGNWAYTLTTAFSVDGSYTVAAQQSDSAGNTGTATTRTIVVDKTAPAVVISSVNGAARTFPYTTNTTVTNVGGTCGTAPGDAATVAITIGGAGSETGNANCTAGAWTYTLTTAFSADGSYTVAAQQTDSAGNTGIATTRTIVVDASGPAVVIASVNGTARTFPYTTNTTVTNVGGTCGTAPGDAATVAITIGGAGSETGNANCTAGAWTYTLTTAFSTDGSYTVAAQQSDNTGNTGTATTRTITVDKTAPAVATTSVNGTARTFPYTTSATVTNVGGTCGTAPGDAATVAITIGGAGSETGNANCTAGAWTYTLTAAFSADGSYTVAAQQTDSAGNTGTATTRTITVDASGPAVAITSVNGSVRTFPYTTNTTVTNVGGTCGTAPGDAATVAITIGGAGAETGNANCTAGNWSYTLTTAFSADGSYTVAAQQSDSTGNTGTATTRTITVDKTAPAVVTTSVNGSVRTFPYATNTNVTSVGGSCGTATGDAATVAITIGGAGTETGNANCTAGAWTYTLTTAFSADGSYTVAAQQTDSAGNTGTATTRTIVVDKTAPAVVTTSVNGSVWTFPYTTNTNVTTVGGTCGTAPGDTATVGITIGGAGAETGTANCTAGAWTYTLTTPFSADGSYTVAAQQADSAGNTGTATTRSIVVDASGPAVVITSVNGSARTFPYTTNTNVTTVGGTCGTATGDAATVGITIGGAGAETGNANCTAGAWTYTLTTPFSADGSYTVAAQQADSAGNTGTATTRTIVVDKTTPVVATTSVNGSVRTFPYTTNTTVTTVGGTCGTAPGDTATVGITIGGAGTETGTANCTAGNWTYTLTTAFSADGSYTVAAQQADSAGNTGTATTRTIVVDKTAPIVATTSVNGAARTFPYTTNTTVTTVAGTCGTAPGDTATVAITIGGAGTETGTANCTAGNWTYTLTTAFSADGSYTVAAQQADSAGNTGTATTRTITVDKTAPIVATTSVNGAVRTFPYTTNTTVTTVAGTCGTAPGDTTTVAITIGGAGTETGTANCTAGNWTYTLTTAFSADGSYTVAAQQADSAGNTGTATTRTITVDKTAPIVATTSVNGAVRTFPYTTNTNVTTVAGTCGTAPGDAATVAITIGGAGTETGTANCTAGTWTYTLTTAFSADGSYTVAAQQADSAGNTGTATTRTITVDKTAPAVATTSVNGSARTFPYTTNTTVTTVGGTCGTAPGDTTSVAITIGGAGTETGTANCTAGTWTYTLTTPFSADGSYTVAAQQADTAGNTGTATTRTITVDKTAPVVATTSVNGSARTFPYTTNTTVINVGGTCGTAPGDTTSVAITIGGAGTETGTANCTAGTWTYTLTTAFSTDGNYTVAAQQADSAGNTGTATTQTITVDKTAPAVATTSVNGSARTFPYTTNTTVTNVGGTCGTAPGDTTSVAITIGGAGSETGTANCTAGTWTYTLTTPFSADGNYTVAAQQSDSAGNTGTATTQTITVDKTAPAVVTTSVNGSARTFPYTTNTTVTNVGGTCGTAPGDAATVGITIGGAGSETGTANCTAGTWTYTLTTPFSADGSYTVAAQQADSAGNTGTATTQTITVDKTAPAVTITSPAPNDITSTTPLISGDRGQATDDLPTVTVNIYAGSTATGTPVQTLVDSGTGSTWSATAATLAAGVYTVQAEQSDAAGNLGTSAPVTFSTA